MKKFEVDKKYKMLDINHHKISRGEIFTVVEVNNTGNARTSSGVMVDKYRLHNGGVVLVDNNEMPDLEAGKHVVKTKYGYGIVVHDERNGVKWLRIGDGYTYQGWDYDKTTIEEVHTIPPYGRGLDPHEYNESTLIWKRDNKKAKLREEHEQLQKQIAELQAKANDIGKLI